MAIVPRTVLRLALLIPAFVALALGVAAGLARMGWAAPLPSPALTTLHGPLMVCGFFGTLIGLERAVAAGRLWGYLAPALTVIGMAALVACAQPAVGLTMIVSGGIALLLLSISAWRLQPALHTAVLVLGAGCWLAGNLLWLAGAALPRLIPWWMGFLVFTIAAERLELSRLLPRPKAAPRLFVALVGLAGVGLAAASAGFRPGQLAMAAGWAGLAGWLLRFDIARYTVCDRGLTRYIAVCLLAGYLWLGLAGLAILVGDGLTGSPAVYDLALHGVFLGFVFSMVFGHAPVILPAVTGLAVPYHPAFYLQLALLHASLLLRTAGIFTGLAGLFQWGGAANAAALGLFVLNTAAAVLRGRRKTA